MPSLVDIFNPSFFIILGVLVLVAALLVVYFESKMREQNHKMASMLNLITNVVDEMNAIKIHLNRQPISSGGSQFQPSSLERNDIHIVKTDLITVSDDSASESDNESENINEESSDSESDNGYESNSEDIQDIDNIREVIDISKNNEHNDIKILKLNHSLSNIDEDENEDKDVNEIDLNELYDLDDLYDLDNESSSDSSSVASNEEPVEIQEDNDNDILDISKLNLKTINISNLEETKNNNHVDYKKFTLSNLRSVVVEKELVADSSKLKKNELLKLLGAE